MMKNFLKNVLVSVFVSNLWKVNILRVKKNPDTFVLIEIKMKPQ